MLQDPPVVFEYAGIRYQVRPHWKFGYIAVFFGKEGLHFKASETFTSKQAMENAFRTGFDAPDLAPVKTVLDQLITRGLADLA